MLMHDVFASADDYLSHFLFASFTVSGGTEGDGLVAKLFLPAEHR
jgi:hypothetical protein